MSHISQIEVEIKDLKALKSACEQLGFDFMENQQQYRWYGKWLGKQPLPSGITEEELGRCDHAIHVPTAVFEIGVARRNNSYILLWDSWIGGGLTQAIGKNAGILKQAYSAATVRKMARQKQYRLTENKMTNKIRLTLSLP